MLERTARDQVATRTPPALLARRILFFTLVGLSIAGMIALAVKALSPGGFGALDLLLVVLFAVTLPWYVIGFWNATIGVLIMRFARDPAAAVTPAAAAVRGDEPITISTAILMCIRNEPPERAARYLAPLVEGLAANPAAGYFHVYLLSDTDQPAVAAAEEAQFAAFAGAFRGRIAVSYRRRTVNTGFKAGNIRDFCERFGAGHEFAVVLDADSVMTAEAVLRLVRIMQADPQLGILQSLVIGLPSTSAFARLFQFGMRLSMRSYTIGSAWWQADCGPYWGHNAIIRLAPFMAHCQLPTLPEGALVGGHVLSHDQIEAVLMRRAGYDVCVLAEEGASFEQNPPTLIEFIRRDLRWCQGNMQYWHFVRMAGLKPVSRYQLGFAILMFLGSPAWMGLLVTGTIAAAAASPAAFMRADFGITLFVLIFILWFAPNIATALDVLMRPQLRRAFGGGLRFTAGVVANMIFFVLIAPIMWFSHTAFIARLLSGRSMGWGVQARDDHAVPLALAWRQLWPQTLLGLATVAVLGVAAPSAIPWALLIAGGPLLSVPLAVVTASPAVGRVLVRIGLGRLPEETAPPPEIVALALPAVEMAAVQRRDA
jgi:membrane glycosyltransferase